MSASQGDSLSTGQVAVRRRAFSSMRRLALTGVLALTGFALSATPSFAAEYHVYSSSFGEPGSGAGQLNLRLASNNPGERGYGGIAVNDDAGDVYVADSNNLRVDQFTSAGDFIRAWGWGVEDGSLEAQTCTEATGCQAGISGNLPGQFASPDYIAVDNSGGPSGGAVYVADTVQHRITKFAANGALVGAWGSGGQLNGSAAAHGPFGKIDGIAVDTSGNLGVLTSNQGGYLFRFAQDGTLLTEAPIVGNGESSPYNGGLAINPVTDFFDVSVLGVPFKFLASGTTLGKVAPYDERLRFTGLAVDSSSGTLYGAAEDPNRIPHEAQIDAYRFNGSGEIVERAGGTCPITNQGCPPSDIFNLGPLNRASGLAVNSITHFVYAGDAGSQEVDVSEPVPGVTLTVDTPGTGTGVVTSKPEGMPCGTICAAEYGEGSTVTLTAYPEIGSTFVGWTGCDAEPKGRCEVEMTAARSVDANFTATADHIFDSYISGSGPTALSGPTEVAVDESSHDIYVNDPGNFRVVKFDRSGNFLLMFGRKVNQTTGGNLCPEQPGDVCQPGIAGGEPGQFRSPTFLTIDNSGGPSDGAVYVGDPVTHLVQKFDSSGHLVSSWGNSGQKDGSDAVEENPFKWLAIFGIDVNAAGDLYVHTSPFQGAVYIFAQNGNYIRRAASRLPEAGKPGFRVDSAGNFYKILSVGAFSDEHKDAVVEDADSPASQSVGQVTSAFETTGFAFDHSNNSLYQGVGAFDGTKARFPVEEMHSAGIEQYDTSCDAARGVCNPINSFGVGHLFGARGIAVDGTNSTVYAANSESNDIAVFVDNRPTVTTGPLVATTETSATLSGTVDPASHGIDHGPVTVCRLEYGFTNAYGNSVPCEPDPQSAAFSSSTAVMATITGLTPLKDLPPGTIYHYRFVASNESGSTGRGGDRSFRTTAPPEIEGVFSTHVTATTADLEANVDPHGLATTYTFEYGITPEYGQTVGGEISGTLVELSEPHAIKAHIEGLQGGVTYHFRLVAHNADSVEDSVSEDQTFDFFPPSCPNSAVRQQTGAAYLPDCRGYELVSPGNANATLFYPGGPNTGRATSPSRLSYTGLYSAPAGFNPINTAGDLYVSTRGSTGWIPRYVGLAGHQAGCMSGPPTDGRNQQSEPRRITNGILTDPSMNRFMSFLGGTAMACGANQGYLFNDQDVTVASPSMAPFLWGADGNLEQRLPAELTSNPAALQALNCPYESPGNNMGHCTGETTASGDLTHIIFSSASMSFSGAGEPAGLTIAPGSAYDQNLATGEISLISRLPAALGGGPIPQDPTFANKPRIGGPGSDHIEAGGKEEFIRVPAVSEDGSHILMSTATTGAPLECKNFNTDYPCERYIEDPVHLYMRIDAAATYQIAEDSMTHQPAPVTFVGMTPDGSKVFFTSEEHLTHEFEEHGGTSLFMWSATKAENDEDPLTLISKGASEVPGAPGNTADCEPAPAPLRGNASAEHTGAYEGPKKSIYKARPWTTSCGIVPYSGYHYSWLRGGLGGSGFEGRSGGSGFTPAGISDSGDIYFYSPEKLDGIHGAPGLQNLFLYRNGQLNYVTTLDPERRCGPHGVFEDDYCSDGPAVRLQVTPDGSHMAFITATRVTPYDNAGHLQMYTYTPATGAVRCVSCHPDGSPPTADVYGSQNGLFLTDDGRAFFSTTDALVPRDTNEGVDVYEYVAGRPQLITPGTGTAAGGSAEVLTDEESLSSQVPGLVGVSADGTDVYFSTFDSLIPEDQNGNFLKFYDARTGGGFAQPAPILPCGAAEECHGPGTEAPELPTQATAAVLSGGNVKSSPKKTRAKHRKRKGKAKHKGKRTAKHSRRITR